MTAKPKPKLTATERKKAMTLIMSKLAKHFGLGLRYPYSALKTDDIEWLAQEHQQPDANELLDQLIKVIYDSLTHAQEA